MRTSVCVWWPLLFSAVAGRQVPIFWPASYFLLFFQEIPLFPNFLGSFLVQGKILNYLR